ncbi:cytochrome c oxidase subunit II [Altericroceibacterium endophyticum]|uniref:Cytochrome c oxidase subunit 2 n=1 Tax=Altericroceibacterium endophyticum TaxID=1808508 RepID=A0A6I4T7I0_9SPHN|nr:cytochrome c oxidase subunit II [Altericroceibacterium endophyticum]MXO66916.1 cytochrome c oxidase subunit II [Altericroceibacterium endophyticum]
MNFCQVASKQLKIVRAVILAFALVVIPQAVSAQDTAAANVQTQNVADASVPAEVAADGQNAEAAVGADAYKPLGPDMIVGQPTPGGMTFQEQYSPNGEYALWMHDAILLPIIVAISLLVLGLLMWVVVRYNRRSNKVASKTSHNTVIEVIWTLVPVLILVVIAVPSITLLSRQYESPPEDAFTVKVTGYQWYWGYSYPDNGDFEVISNMLDDDEAVARGLPEKLAVDNRMVVPVGEPIRIQTTGADVIHSFALPSLWFKLDAVPGRLNEKMLLIQKPGIYYGQCSELCGVRHGYMPIAIEALPRPQFEAWVLSQGGEIGGEDVSDEPEAADLQEPESSVEGAPGAGAPPVDAEEV